jgi:hypothetical protein
MRLRERISICGSRCGQSRISIERVQAPYSGRISTRRLKLVLSLATRLLCHDIDSWKVRMGVRRQLRCVDRRALAVLQGRCPGGRRCPCHPFFTVGFSRLSSASNLTRQVLGYFASISSFRHARSSMCPIWRSGEGCMCFNPTANMIRWCTILPAKSVEYRELARARFPNVSRQHICSMTLRVRSSRARRSRVRDRRHQNICSASRREVIHNGRYL